MAIFWKEPGGPMDFFSSFAILSLSYRQTGRIYTFLQGGKRIRLFWERMGTGIQMLDRLRIVLHNET